MNFFFWNSKNHFFKSNLTIPIFNNDGHIDKSCQFTPQYQKIMRVD